MKKVKFLLILVALVVSAYGMLHVKHRVQVLTKELIEIKRQMTMEKEALHVLKAEWAYLNQPERLKFLADQYLTMDYIKNRQVALSMHDGLLKKGSTRQRSIAATPTLKPTLSRF
jgi:cell division protein FtsL